MKCPCTTKYALLENDFPFIMNKVKLVDSKLLNSVQYTAMWRPNVIQ